MDFHIRVMVIRNPLLNLLRTQHYITKMLMSVLNAEVCDATGDDSSNAADLLKKNTEGDIALVAQTPRPGPGVLTESINK